MYPVRQFYRMRIDFDGKAPPEPEWPEGIALRSYRHPEDFEAVIATDYEAFRDHWGFIERPLDEEIDRWRHFVANDPNFDPRYWFVAVDGDEIAGVALCLPVSVDAPTCVHIDSIAVLRPWRRRGLATALLNHIFVVAYADGKEGATLGADAENVSGAIQLYLRAGMEPTLVNHVYEKVLREGTSIIYEG